MSDALSGYAYAVAGFVERNALSALATGLAAELVGPNHQFGLRTIPFITGPANRVLEKIPGGFGFSLSTPGSPMAAGVLMSLLVNPVGDLFRKAGGMTTVSAEGNSYVSLVTHGLTTAAAFYGVYNLASQNPGPMSGRTLLKWAAVLTAGDVVGAGTTDLLNNGRVDYL